MLFSPFCPNLRSVTLTTPNFVQTALEVSLKSMKSSLKSMETLSKPMNVLLKLSETSSKLLEVSSKPANLIVTSASQNYNNFLKCNIFWLNLILRCYDEDDATL
jgi:hypothetical protein